MGVFHAETFEQHFGIAIGNVVAVAVRIKQQIGRLADVDSAIADR